MTRTRRSADEVAQAIVISSREWRRCVKGGGREQGRCSKEKFINETTGKKNESNAEMIIKRKVIIKTQVVRKRKRIQKSGNTKPEYMDTHIFRLPCFSYDPSRTLLRERYAMSKGPRDV